MRPSMIEVFAFHIDLGAAKLLAQVVQMGKWRGTAGVAHHEGHILVPKGRISLRGGKGHGEFVDSLVQNFWNKGPTEGAIIPLTSRWELKEFLVHAVRGPSLICLAVTVLYALYDSTNIIWNICCGHWSCSIIRLKCTRLSRDGSLSTLRATKRRIGLHCKEFAMIVIV